MNIISSNTQKLKIKPIVLAYFIMLISMVFNGNKYHASMAFIMPQTVLALFCCLVSFIRGNRISCSTLSDYLPSLLLVTVSFYSTLVSDVVSWNSMATSLLVYFSLFVLMSIKIQSIDEVRSVFRIYSLITLFIAFAMIINVIIGYSIIDGRVSISFFGVRKDENYLSAFLVFGFFYYLLSAVFGTKKKKYYLFSFVIFFAIFMTGSRGALIAMLSCVAVLFAYVILRNGLSSKAIVFSLLIVIFLSIGYFVISRTSLFSRMSDLSGYTSNIRLVIWGYAIEGFTRKPLIGSGIQSGTYFAQLHVRWFTHSCFVDLITSAGILGVVAFVWQITRFFIGVGRIDKGNNMFIGCLILTMFVPLMFINGFETATFWVLVAICKISSDSCRVEGYHQLLV